MTDQSQALSFGTAAAEYDRFRPTYPADAVQWAVGGPPPRRVVDLGAGTGILTRVLLRTGYDAVPVEPDPAMRAQLTASTQGVTALGGSAEAVPLPDASADSAVAGQAYHWFDRDRAHPEIARVLRPGGFFGAIWNHRDDAEPWVADVSRITNDVPDARGQFEPGSDLSFSGTDFGPVERAEFRHSITHTPDSLVAVIATRSYFLTAPPQRQAELSAGVRELLATHPDLAGRETFELPYRVIVYRAQVLRS